MELLINGHVRAFPDLSPGASVAELVVALDLKGDRVAIEHNGQIVSRPCWTTTSLTGGDRMEIVHFVGGGVGLGVGAEVGRVGCGVDREPARCQSPALHEAPGQIALGQTE